MVNLICPVCSGELCQEEKRLLCTAGHSFDIAKSGYVNLLLSQRGKDKHHGDDKEMVRSRRDFLDKGYYAPLREAICSVAQRHARPGFVMLDAGCGECYYTAAVYQQLADAGMPPKVIGVDISKDALALGAKRSGALTLAVASVFHLPVPEHSCDMLCSIFAPYDGDAFARVLKPGGILLRAIPLENHLWELKQAVYDSPYRNEVEDYTLPGFRLLEAQELRFRIHLPSGEDVQNLFTMTPYHYKTSAQDRAKLSTLQELDTEAEFGVLVYQKADNAEQ